ncbi:osmotically inducible protein OsmC [Palleronia marisminoris]|uniref:Peroxiredoxin OsmC n=1 Tax=Palleronia marisminoris TaxID=315423 RepID=A0A1Y5RG27_9RHOB|nr:OsmC family protein [Palleronia marisminoris]SFG17648.1 osmotically inducible protein OsmC [Palleronia marisminoris]SLN16684.1 Peroxiredoxin OsmC [Palleronia marisminoris]
MIKKHGTANWKGGLKDGTGTVSTQTGVLDKANYGFKSRFEDGTNTNPEELIGAAHAACFSMALSMILGQSDLTPDNIDTKATVSLEQLDSGFTVTKIHLEVTASVPNASEDQFMEAAQKAKENCPISKALAGPEITMDAKLV